MKSLLLVLTERDTWTTNVAGKPSLFWCLEGIKAMAEECWIHVVYHKTPKTDLALAKTFKKCDWAKIGDLYGVPNKHKVAYGAKMAFPSYSQDYGCYIYDASVVFSPGLMTYMGDVDWFPYAEEPTPLDLKGMPTTLGIPPVISPLGFYSFGTYMKLFNLVDKDTRDPILVYKDMVSEDRVLASKIEPQLFHRVKTLDQIARFSELVK